jgi:predicted RNase H-like nuclease (RuvC/YqgF family)
MLKQEGLHAQLPKAPDRQRGQEEISKVRQEIVTVQVQLATLTEDMASLTSAIDALKQQLAAHAAREKQLQEATAVQKTRTAELERLQQEKQRQQQRLAALQADLARAQDKGYTLASGAPLVQQDRKARLSYFVMLTEGKVIPVTPAYYTGKQVANDVVAIWPKDKHTALTIQQVLQKDSPLMKEVTTPEFRRDGRVKMLVNPDSFDTFRALRDALVKRDIDYGWEPHEGTKILTSTRGTGKDIESHRGK